MSGVRGVAAGLCGLVVVLIASASAQGAATPIDLGANVQPIGEPALVSQQYDVPVLSPGSIVQRLWEGTASGGTVNAPTAPSSDPSAVFNAVAVNSSGVVVGFAQQSSGHDVPAYWDSEHSGSFVEVSLAGLIVNGQPAAQAQLTSIDAAGEAVGFVTDHPGGAAADYAGLFAPSSSGLPTGTPAVVTSLHGYSVDRLDRVSSGFEGGFNPTDGFISYARQAGTATATGVTSAEKGGAAASDGGAVGFETADVPGQYVPMLYRPGAGDVALQVPSGGSGVPYDVASGGRAVGDVTDASNAHTQVLWSADGSSVPVASLFAAGGWTSLQGTPYIDDAGDIAAQGDLSGTLHGYLLPGSPPAPPVVNSTGDGAAQNSGGNGCNTGQTILVNGISQPECTLRAAIQAENAGSVSQKTISFALPSGGSTIQPRSVLPALTAAGVTVAGGGITLDGQGQAAVGLDLSGATQVVTGLRLVGWQTGVKVDSPAGGDTLSGLQVSDQGYSSASWYATSAGIAVASSPSNVIGGVSASAGDVITSVAIGVRVDGAGASGNMVEGDQIGPSGTGGSDGLVVEGVAVTDASGTTVGGSTSTPGTAPGNVIDGEAGHGVTIAGVGSTVVGASVQGNLIGLAPGGTAKAGSFQDGVLVAGLVRAVTIGGAGAGNAIAGSRVADVSIDGTSVSDTRVVSDLIGTNATGTASVEGGEQAGVLVQGASHTTIGTAGTGRDVISGAAGGSGVYVVPTTTTVTLVATGAVAPGTTTTQTSSMGTTISGDVIGPLEDGRTLSAGLQVNGVVLGGTGDTLGPANEISGNQIGVVVSGTREAVLGNLIGADATGLRALPNGIGIAVNKAAKDDLIGVAGSQRNTISGNTGAQVLLSSAATMQNNLIGTNASGTGALAPFAGTLPEELQAKRQPAAVVLAAGISATTQIGGTSSTAGNVISGNDTGALLIDSPAVVQANRIGVAAASNTAIPNDGIGITGQTTSTLGADPKSGKGANVIAHERDGGIDLDGRARYSSMVSDSLFANGTFGIREANPLHEPPSIAAVQNPGGGTEVTLSGSFPKNTLAQVYRTTDCARHDQQGQTLLATVRFGKAHTGATIKLHSQYVGTKLTATSTTIVGPAAATTAFAACATVSAAPKVNAPKVDGSTVQLPVACPGNSTCGDITVQETITEPASETPDLVSTVMAKTKPKKAKKKAKTKTVVIARLRVTLKRHHRRTVTVNLNRTGRRMLTRARHHRLTATLRVSAHGVTVKQVRLRLR